MGLLITHIILVHNWEDPLSEKEVMDEHLLQLDVGVLKLFPVFLVYSLTERGRGRDSQAVGRMILSHWKWCCHEADDGRHLANHLRQLPASSYERRDFYCQWKRDGESYIFLFVLLVLVLSPLHLLPLLPLAHWWIDAARTCVTAISM